MIWPVRSMLKMYKDGMSIEDIATELGSATWDKYWKRTTGAAYKPAPQVIHKILDRNGCKFRDVGAQDGALHWNWHGGLTTDKQGYILEAAPGHPNADSRGYVRAHRRQMERHLGRYLTPTEVVHHRDSNKQNNAIENLELFANNGLHRQHELLGKPVEPGTLAKRRATIQKNKELKSKLNETTEKKPDHPE